ncbi:MAG: protein DpdG [Verrucomicrobiota bacterium]
MSLLNLPTDGIYTVLVAIFPLLLSKKNLTKEQLRKLCAPPEACHQGHISGTLNTWISLGLFDVNSDGAVTIHPDVLGSERKLENLRKIARRLALDPKNNADLWAKEGTRSADFTSALSWFLAQDAWSTEIKSDKEADSILTHQLPSGEIKFQNNTRWNGFNQWTSFLGFGCNPRFSSGITPDPTEAVRDALPAVFGKHKTLPAKDFIRKIGDALPVLDGGDYRRQVEGALLSQDSQYSWRALPEDQLSTSLSRALVRLHEEGVLRHSLKADVHHQMRVRLTGRGGGQILKDISEFSHHS